MRASQPAKPPVFNRGGTLEELRAKALEETGMEAPTLPWEVPMRGPHTGLPYVRKWLEEHGQVLKPLPTA
jgi:5-oxoprolinase (ATP-hydrolysing)